LGCCRLCRKPPHADCSLIQHRLKGDLLMALTAAQHHGDRPPVARGAQVQLGRSGSRGTLPPPSPLRTVRASCPAYGSSLCRLVADLLMVFVVTPSVQEAQVLHLVFTAPLARMGVVLVHHVHILVRVERNTA